jgi:hypothetical protein
MSSWKWSDEIKKPDKKETKEGKKRKKREKSSPLWLIVAWVVCNGENEERTGE